jgi:hypothetical protein
LAMQAEVTRRRVFLCISTSSLFRKMPSKEIDHIEIANSKSIGEFIDEYLPPELVLPTPTVAASETI